MNYLQLHGKPLKATFRWNTEKLMFAQEHSQKLDQITSTVLSLQSKISIWISAQLGGSKKKKKNSTDNVGIW